MRRLHRCASSAQVCVVCTGVRRLHRCASSAQVCVVCCTGVRRLLHRCASCIVCTGVRRLLHRCASSAQVCVVCTGVRRLHRCASSAQVCVVHRLHRCASSAQVCVVCTGVRRLHRCASSAQVCVVCTGVRRLHRQLSCSSRSSQPLSSAFNLSALTFALVLFLLFWDAVFHKAEVKRTTFLRYHECVINHFSGEQRVTIHQRAVSSSISLSCLHLTYEVYTEIKKIKKNDRTISLWASAHKHTDSSQTSVSDQNRRLSFYHFFTVNYHSNIWGQ